MLLKIDTDMAYTLVGIVRTIDKDMILRLWKFRLIIWHERVNYCKHDIVCNQILVFDVAVINAPFRKETVNNNRLDMKLSKTIEYQQLFVEPW